MVAVAGGGAMGPLIRAVGNLSQRMGAMTGALRRISASTRTAASNTARQTNLLRGLQSVTRAGTARTVNAIGRLSGTLSRGLGSITNMFRDLYKSQAAQRAREMLGRIGDAGVRGAGRLAAPIKSIYETLKRPLDSIFTWGTAIAGLFALFVNSKYWTDFKNYLAQSIEEGGWLATIITFFTDIAKMDFDEIKNKVIDAVYDFGNIFVDMMNSMIEVYNKMAALPLVPLEPKKPLERFERDDPAFKNMDIESGGVERVSAEASPEAAEEVSKNFLDTSDSGATAGVDEKLTNLAKSEQAARRLQTERQNQSSASRQVGDVLGLTPIVDLAMEGVRKILPQPKHAKIKEIAEVRDMSDEEFKEKYNGTDMNRQDFIIKLLNELKDNLIIRKKDSAEEIADLKKQIESGGFTFDTGFSIEDEKLELKTEKERMTQLNQAMEEIDQIKEGLALMTQKTSEKSAPATSVNQGPMPIPSSTKRLAYTQTARDLLAAQAGFT